MQGGASNPCVPAEALHMVSQEGRDTRAWGAHAAAGHGTDRLLPKVILCCTYSSAIGPCSSPSGAVHDVQAGTALLEQPQLSRENPVLQQSHSHVWLAIPWVWLSLEVREGCFRQLGGLESLPPGLTMNCFLTDFFSLQRLLFQCLISHRPFKH